MALTGACRMVTPAGSHDVTVNMAVDGRWITAGAHNDATWHPSGRRPPPSLQAKRLGQQLSRYERSKLKRPEDTVRFEQSGFCRAKPLSANRARMVDDGTQHSIVSQWRSISAANWVWGNIRSHTVDRRLKSHLALAKYIYGAPDLEHRRAPAGPRNAMKLPQLHAKFADMRQGVPMRVKIDAGSSRRHGVCRRLDICRR